MHNTMSAHLLLVLLGTLVFGSLVSPPAVKKEILFGCINSPTERD